MRPGGLEDVGVRTVIVGCGGEAWVANLMAVKGVWRTSKDIDGRRKNVSFGVLVNEMRTRFFKVKG